MDKYEELFVPAFLKNEKRPAIPYDATVTMAYIPIQETIDTYTEDKALDNGTLFPQLNKPFLGRMVEK